jgi:vitamin B12 transporter
VYGISLSKWLCKNWKLFVNTSSAYKTPSLYQLYSEYGNRSLKPEVATTWEAGAQYFLKDKTSYLRALWFKRDVKDVMFFYTDPVTYASKYVNQDKQMDQGVEADASIAITKHTQFRMNYQYVGGSITTIVNGEEKKYNNLFRRARNQFNMQLEHTFKKGWYLSAGLVSVGKRYDLWFDPSSFQSKEVVLPSYVLLNMYLSYQVPGRMWTFFADLRNLADEPYTEIYGYNTLGFNGYLGMRFSLHQDKRSAPRKRVSLPSNVGNKRHRRS